MPDYDVLAEGKKKAKQLRHGISIKNFWATPYDVFDCLDQEFDFELDAAATMDSAKCKEWFGLDHPNPSMRDAFKCGWGGRTFCNMPYSPDGGGIFKWVMRAHTEVNNGNAELCVLLLPSSTDTEWAEFLWEQGAELRFTPRIAFVDPEGGRTNPMGGSLIAIIRPKDQPRSGNGRDRAFDEQPIIFGYAPWKGKG